LKVVTESESFRKPNGRQVQRFVAAALSFVIAIVLCLRWFLSPEEQTYDAIDYMSYDECKGRDFSVLNFVAPGKIAVPLGASIPLAFALPRGFPLRLFHSIVRLPA